ncbi:MAG: helix-turn-helix domain-containing protein [Lachnospiraceae bacterium]|nr:helix-turn-helix domain-containing protein [Lachnospiraceae bacterium]
MGQKTLNQSTLGKRISEVRKDRGYTSDQASELFHMSPDYLRQIECGKCNKTPSLALFIDICNALRISPDYLLRDQLEANEITQIKELELLWEKVPPSKQELAIAMIKAALEYNGE